MRTSLGVSSHTSVLKFSLLSHTEQIQLELCKIATIRRTTCLQNKQRSHAVSTERTILSPFTKEYRVLAANSGIRQFLEGFLLIEEPL